MEYSNILKTAWQATWRHKAMWFLGMAIMGGCNTVTFNTGGNIGSVIDTSDYQTANMMDGLFELLEQYWLLVLLFGICFFLLILVAWVVHYIALGGIYHGAMLAKQDKPVRFWALCQAGTQTFWRVVGTSLLFSIVIGAVMTIVVLSLIFLAFTVIGLIIVIPAIFLLVILALPMSWIIGTLFSFTIQGIVVEQYRIWQSCKAAYALFKKHWLGTLIAYASVVGWSVAAMFLAIILVVLIGFPVAIFVVVAYTSQAWLALGLAVLAGVSIFGLILLFIKGISQSFAAHTWHGFYIACRDS